MSDKFLVTYGTWTGSTQDVAQAIGEQLRETGATVTVQPAQEVQDPGGYQGIVIGSGIRAGKLHPHVLKLLETYQDALSQTKVAYFVVCMTMHENTEENRCTVEAYLDAAREIAPQIQPVEIGLFAGAMDYKKLPLPIRLIIKAMKTPEGDFRDWEAIRNWAAHLPAAFSNA